MRFFGPNPALMVVEPESLCWITGRMAGMRDGATWAGEFARLPALKAVVRDDGTGLGKGVGLDNARRREAGLPEFDQALDVFPTLRELCITHKSHGHRPSGRVGQPTESA